MTFMVRNRRRRNNKAKRFFVTVIVLGLLVFLGADNFGFDWFNFKINLNNNATKTESPISKETSSSSNIYINIVIKEDKITLNDELVEFSNLSDELSAYKSKETIVNLMDNSAFNVTFTEVEDLLSNKGYRVIISDIK
jgi:biopolymer transport protein ExbD